MHFVISPLLSPSSPPSPLPLKLIPCTSHSQGHVVTLEITSGQVYRGKLIEAEDNMNVQLKDITVTARDGRVSHLDQVYIRGSHVRFFIVPDMLRYVFESARGEGRGRREGGDGSGRETESGARRVRKGNFWLTWVDLGMRPCSDRERPKVEV
jgi:small nuclear ribonucleoprotein D3